MKVTLLGTGTSQGIPIIGCICAACTSSDYRDNRTRCSALVETEAHNIILDVGPDFRQQALKHKLTNLTAVFLTHEHNDHVAGLDDLRPLIFRNGKSMPIYAEKRVLDDIKVRYKYAFTPQPYPGAPSFELNEIQPDQVVRIGELKIQARRVYHGGLPILAFVVQDQLAYLTDTNHVPEPTLSSLNDIPILVLDMLRVKKHHSHFDLISACELAASISARKTFLIHLSHLMGPTKEWERGLPSDVFPSYDGLSFDLPTD